MARDPRHQEARGLVELARKGSFRACTTTGVLSEVYAALTWQGAEPQTSPEVAANSVGLLINPPSAIEVLQEDLASSRLMLDMVRRHRLTARRVHDARHAAAALCANIRLVYTYDLEDWQRFEADGLHIAGPASVVPGSR